MSENILLVVQTPNRGGQRGHQFLIAHIDPTKFDDHMWMKGKSDQLILTLADVQKRALKKCNTGVESLKFVHHMILTRQAPNIIINVTLDFALPTHVEVSRAIQRQNIVLHQKRVMDHEQMITELERSVMGHTHHITSILRSIDVYRAYLKQLNLLSGVRCHYERVLIKDRKSDLRYVRSELRSAQDKLTRAKAARKKLNSL